MTKMYILALLMCLLAPVQSAHGQVLSELSLPPNGANERAEVSQWIGPVKITIDYHSPNVHGARERTAPVKFGVNLCRTVFLIRAWALREPLHGERAPMK